MAVGPIGDRAVIDTPPGALPSARPIDILSNKPHPRSSLAPFRGNPRSILRLTSESKSLMHTSVGRALRRTIQLAAIAAFLCGRGNVARGDALDEVAARGTLIWGADQEGGGPFVFPDENDPTILRGFEVELAEMLAEEVGKQLGKPVRAQFRQGQWENLPLLLDGTIDLVLNGYEMSPERQRDYLCSRPYYLYGLQLMAKRDSPIQSWDDLRPRAGRARLSAGVLTGSAAERYFQAPQEWNADLVAFDGNTNAMEKVANGQLDVTLQDDCIALFYADRFPGLKFVGRPVGEGFYVALVSKQQPRLHKAIDAALGRIIADGRLESLYDQWDMSGKAQMLALRDTTEVAAAASRSWWEIVRSNLPILLESAGMTVLLSVCSMPLAIAIGILVAVGRIYGPRLIATPLGWYVELLRGTPLMLQLYAIFYLLPKVTGVNIPPVLSGIAGLAINYSAYEAEIYRAGLQAIPRGQMEAALALGMSKRQAIWRIVLPQAFRLVIPPVTNDFIALFKDTSVCSVITIVELTKRYSVLALSTGAFVELASVTALLYLLMSYPLSLFARWSERKLAGGQPRH